MSDKQKAIELLQRVQREVKWTDDTDELSQEIDIFLTEVNANVR